MAERQAGRAAGSSSDASPPDRLLKEEEAANRLGLSVKTLRRWRWAGKPPAFLKIGAAVRYDPMVIADFIEASRRTSTSDPGLAAA